MNGDVITRKMESLRRCIHRLKSKKPIIDWSTLADDYDLQDILCVNLERAVQLSVDIGVQLLILRDVKPPGTMAEVFSSLESQRMIDAEVAANLRSAVGFRNIAVHEYQEINWEIVRSILTNHLDDFLRYMRAVAVIVDSLE